MDRFCLSRWTLKSIWSLFSKISTKAAGQLSAHSKVLIKSWPTGDLSVFEWYTVAEQLQAETQDFFVSDGIFSHLNARYF